MTQTANTFHVDCPSCFTSFPVDPAKVPDDGVLARCSSCEGVFRVQKPEDDFGAHLTPEAAVHEETGSPASPVDEAAAVATDSAWGAEPAVDHDSSEAWVPEPAADADTSDTWTAEPATDQGAGDTAEDSVAVDETADEWGDEPVALEDTAVEVSEEPEPFVGAGDEISADVGTAAAELTDAVETFEVADPFGEPAGFDDAVDAVTHETGAVEDTLDAGLDQPLTFDDPADTALEAPTTVGVDEPSGASAPAAPVSEPAPMVFGKRDPKEKAQRLARVLVSDMITYNKDRHTQALAQGTLVEDFEDEIKKSWAEYVDQVGEEIAEGTPYFTDALNEILAQGETVF